MRSGITHQQTTGWRATVARWLMLCLVVRALLPAGFMPEFRGGDEPGLHFVICSSDGGITSGSAPSKLPDNGASGLASAQCVFAGLASLALPQFGAAAVTAPLRAAADISIPSLAVHRPQIAGPQVGARAPPSI